MTKRTILPFGPQHPVLPEPIHLDLVLEDEKVVDVIPSIGYIHRGLELLVKDREFTDMVYVAERICGICSFVHGMGYCQAVENVMNLEMPERALFLRSIWTELSRLHSHLLWLGLIADAFGFESLFMHSWKVRELILDIFEETTGGRVIFGVNKIGGVRKDIDADTLAKIKKLLPGIKKEVDAVAKVFLNDSSVKHRTVDVGVLSKADAHSWGAVGPMGRASGLDFDMRKLGYAAYDKIEFDPVVDNGCDSYARIVVRVKEIYQSIEMLSQFIDKIPEGPVDQKITTTPNGEYFARLEQPRGEVVYYVKGNGTKFLDRFRVRTPTFANIPPMIKILKGCDLADVPIIVLTIDPCISCTER
jgi:ech hydrogenase subunit E